MSASLDVHHSSTRRTAGVSTTTTDGRLEFHIENGKLLELLECLICSDYVLPPIYQCYSGHLLCSKCFSRVEMCPSCHGARQSIRNLFAEKLARLVVFPCKHASHGCSTFVLYDEKLEHENNCELRPCPCPIPFGNCQWSGARNQVTAHVLDCYINHGFDDQTKLELINTIKLQHTGDTVSLCFDDIDATSTCGWVRILACHDQDFIFTMIRRNRRNKEAIYYTFVKLVGTQQQTEDYLYRLKLCQSSNFLIYQDTTRCIYDNTESIIEGEGSKCLTFMSFTAKKFAQNGQLSIEVTISKKTSVRNP